MNEQRIRTNEFKISIVDIWRYYMTYHDIEKSILKDITNSNSDTRELALKNYLNKHMRIGRNFRKGTEHMIYETTKNYLDSGNNEVEELSQLFYTKKLLSKNIKNAKVAASKLMWLFIHESIIMDRLNMKVLGIKNDSYLDYQNKWLAVFNSVDNRIKELINESDLPQIDDVVNNKWFRMRVFDQFLWTLGKS